MNYTNDSIGYLGICGCKFPLKKGPNKIGRDPAYCSVIINLNSISRLHAMINILNSKEFMLMDLDSTNKTKLGDRTLDAFIPRPLKNADIVQFGKVFGVFRIFEEDNDLPMTQEIYETPVQKKHNSKQNSLHESEDIPLTKFIAMTTSSETQVQKKNESTKLFEMTKSPETLETRNESTSSSVHAATLTDFLDSSDSDDSFM